MTDAVLPCMDEAAALGWVLSRNPANSVALRDVPRSESNTAELTRKALEAQGLAVVSAPRLRDVDTIADAREVAGKCWGSRFARVVKMLELK